MRVDAQIAVYAAKHIHQWGEFAARRYAVIRGVPLKLYHIARQCESEAHCNTINGVANAGSHQKRCQ